jgi:hypothetical protein
VACQPTCGHQHGWSPGHWPGSKLACALLITSSGSEDKEEGSATPALVAAGPLQ